VCRGHAGPAGARWPKPVPGARADRGPGARASRGPGAGADNGRALARGRAGVKARE